ncbi:hypothetical protein ABEB36_004338 [Hypothenemus hampei]|uniref:Rhabdoid tumor deletion region protein 1 n=1 Tax=Hypothenemus hampei TaxID=57062 RepID=A0ABD1F3D1_HYPHA
MFSHFKNSYLQGNCQDINSGVINRCVQRAWDEIKDINGYCLEPEFNKLTSEQPNIPIDINPFKISEGFGRIALPKLRRELHSADIEIVIAALTSLSDIVHYPERCYEAIRLKVTDRLVDLLCHELPPIRERAAFTLKVLAGMAMGKEFIVNNEDLLENLLEKVEDEFVEVRIHVAACLEMIARYWKTADVLVEMGFIPILLANLFDAVEIVEIHLDTLYLLFYCDGKQIAIDGNGFDILTKLLNVNEGPILAKAVKALSSLCMIKEGRQLAKEYRLLNELSRLLYDDRIEVHTAAAEAMIFCTIKSEEKIIASKIKGIPKRPIHLCKNRLNPSTQLFAIKALTSLCEHPKVRNEVNEKYYGDVEKVQITSERPEIQYFKNTLMQMLQWTPHRKN